MRSLVKPRHFNLYKNYTEQLISDLSQNVTLVFSNVTSECPNCHYDIIHKCSSGKYKTGGPQQFEKGICPVCRGKGKITQDKSVTKKCTIKWIDINTNEGAALMSAGKVSKGFYKLKTLVSNYQNFKDAEHLVVEGNRCRVLNIGKRGLKENVTAIIYCTIED